MNHKKLVLVNALIAVAALIGYLMGLYLLENPALPLPPPRPDATLALFIVLKSVISVINIALLLTLVAIYGSLYRELRSRFTLGLLLLVIVLLMYAITSNPIFHSFLGYPGTVLGPFTIIPDMFSTLAFIVLLYLSQE